MVFETSWRTQYSETMEVRVTFSEREWKTPGCLACRLPQQTFYFLSSCASAQYYSVIARGAEQQFSIVSETEYETQRDGKNVLWLRGRKKCLQAIRRWESRTFLGKWWRQQDAVLFIFFLHRDNFFALLATKRNGCARGQFIHHSKPWACSLLFNLSCLGVDVFAALLPSKQWGSQITPFLHSQTHQHCLHRSTSHQSVTDEWGKKKKKTQTHPSMVFRAMWCWRQRKWILWPYQTF